MEDSNNLVLIGLLITLIVGYLTLTVAEILLLRKKGWIDGNLSLTYPLVTNGLNLPVALIAYMIAMFVIMIMAFFVLPSISFGVEDTRLQTGLLIAYWLVSAVFIFLVFWGAFLLVRMLTTKLMVKSSMLTWKYKTVQAAIPAGLVAVIYFLLNAIPYWLLPAEIKF
jgi:hypothetical protein